MDPNTTYPVIDLMPEQQNMESLGGTMRLGKYHCSPDGRDTFSHKAYGVSDDF